MQPIPFSVRAYSLPDLFAGKLHAVLFRKWGSRVKGRDWYDMVWFAGRHPSVSLTHLEQRMRQSGNWTEPKSLDAADLRRLLLDAVARLDIDQARAEVVPFVRDRRALDVWSAGFFTDVIGRITPASGTGDKP